MGIPDGGICPVRWKLCKSLLFGVELAALKRVPAISVQAYHFRRNQLTALKSFGERQGK